MKLKLKSKKSKHINYVRDHIFGLHRKLATEALSLDELKGKELNHKVKQIQSISSRMKECKKYLNLVLI